MLAFYYETKLGSVHIRQATEEDIPRLIEMNLQAFPLMAEENVVWSERQLLNHIRPYSLRGSSSPRSTDVSSVPLLH
jgi:hypothetical protein